MNSGSHSKPVLVLQIGAGLVGRYLGPLLASLPWVQRVTVMDRDAFTKSQAWHPGEAGRPKAQVVADMMRAINPQLQVEPVIGDIEDLPLGVFRCDLLLTALDSKRARMVANYAFRKLPVRHWIDSGVKAPWLVRVSTFAHAPDGCCYECGLDSSDYASEQSYPCQPQFTPPPTNSPAYLGSLAASLQAAACARVLTGNADPASLNRELIFDAVAQRVILTTLNRREGCRLDHSAFRIRPLRRSPRQVTLAEAFALRPGGTNGRAKAGASLAVPGKLFVRELVCPCGGRRSCLRLKGRLSPSAQACPMCGARMSPTGNGLANVLVREALSSRELSGRMSALGLLPSDVIAISSGPRTNFFELGGP